MSSLIDLEEPFRSVWRKGYLQTHPSGRKYIHLYNSDNDRSIVSYGRYLLCVKEGRFVETGIEADHIDNDFTRDVPENIQGLPATDNVRKAHLSSRGSIKSEEDQFCVICGSAFRLKKDRATCGTAECKSAHLRQTSLANGNRPPMSNNHITQEKKEQIRGLKKEGLSLRKIQSISKINRTTIAKILGEV